MTAIIPLAFEDHLVRSVMHEGSPWFVGRDVCGVLEIKNANDALGRLDDDERRGSVIPTPSGIQETTIISEPGVYRLVFTSRKPSAERFKRWLAHEVLPQLRKTGKYETGRSPDPDPDGEPLQALGLKLATVREARLIYGPERARALWPQLGLPAVPVRQSGGDDEPLRALALVLAARVAGLPLRERLGHAMQGLAEPELPLAGIRAFPDRGEPCFALWCNGPLLGHLQRFEANGEFDGRLGRVLARLPGAEAHAVVSMGGTARRCVILPARWLDEPVD